MTPIDCENYFRKTGINQFVSFYDVGFNTEITINGEIDVETSMFISDDAQDLGLDVDYLYWEVA